MFSQGGLGLPDGDGYGYGSKSETQHQPTDDKLTEGEAGAEKDRSDDNEDGSCSGCPQPPKFAACFLAGKGSEHASDQV